MIRLRQSCFSLAVVMALSAQAQNLVPLSPLKFPSPAANLPPPLPQAQSPVDFFRQLLALSPAERASSLTNRPPEARERILTKVREYQLLNPDERELRLRATELRWHLTPLLRAPVAERTNRLALVPEDLRGLVESRLMQWDILPPTLRQEFLANDKALHYFARVEDTNRPIATVDQQKIAEQFNQFFELTPAEKRQTLGTLSEAERREMEKTLKAFEQLPPAQRFQCLRNYAKFAGMSAAERADFLKNAESWSRLSPKERQSWRDLVARVPAWPPLPPPVMPPNLIPHASPKMPRPAMATNLN
jgi:hypothetical protein